MSGAEGSEKTPWWENQLTRAVTFYPWATMRPEKELQRLVENGVNTLFVVTKESDGRVFYNSEVAPRQVPSRDILGELIDAAEEYDLRVVPVVFVLCDKYLLEQHPSVVQVAREGTEIRYPNVSSEYMHWACPNHESVRTHLYRIVDELTEYDIDGIQFTHFGYQPIRNGDSSYSSCFCEECMARYEKHDVAEDSNTAVDLRCNTTATLLKDLTDPFRNREDCLVSIELEAFADLEAAIEDSRKTLGVDPRDAAAFADVLNPRTAHLDMDLHPLWIREVVRSFRAETGTPVVPSIRTAEGTNPENKLLASELTAPMQLALHGGAAGISMFSGGANVGRITESQWETVTEVFHEMQYLEENESL